MSFFLVDLKFYLDSIFVGLSDQKYKLSDWMFFFIFFIFYFYFYYFLRGTYFVG